MARIFVVLCAACALTGVGFGAFGAHALKATLSADNMHVYQTAVSYQMWHALALGLVAGLQRDAPYSKLLTWAGALIFVGILLFSGSLYSLAISGVKWLGAITPLGGTCFLIAWLLVAIHAIKTQQIDRKP